MAATDITWDRVSFSTRADLSGVNARGRCDVCLGGAAVSSRGSCLSIVITNTNAPAVHTSRSVSVFAVLVIPVPWCWGTAAIWFAFKSKLSFPLSESTVLQLSSSKGVDVVSIIVDELSTRHPIFYIWKAYCILDRSFPWPRYIKGWGWTRFMCGLFWSWAHTHTHTVSSWELSVFII